ncbi:hypothetical protein HJC23_013470 [Cyclotella cryptica]|uniref:Protein kinase A anchor protein nuclear localisation signal domain-containing protein n=1 Tax=Cyclotella cryptica TaxID=29204 RepID=A0ABD3QBX1_9STRA|eukprot:CCRYP_006882-RA/>CCRYP_006882-RA protein AED:0.43 eAED:0.43 QI:0/-1/0/1/-1/1/1/0/380
MNRVRERESTSLDASRSGNSAAAGTPECSGKQKEAQQSSNPSEEREDENQALCIQSDGPAAGRLYNSYLKIVMDDAVFETLHSLMQKLKAGWETMESSSDTQEIQQQSNFSTEIDVEASRPSSDQQLKFADAIQSNPPLHPMMPLPKLKIKPRSLRSLHMTYFFCGRKLDEMPSDQVILWNSKLKEKLCGINSKFNSRGERPNYSLRLKALDVFPPQRRNLIVATFESSSDLDELYEELCDLAMTPKSELEQANSNDGGDAHSYFQKEYEFPLLRKPVSLQMKKRRQRQKRNKHHSAPWMAHVTLANIVGGKNGGIKQLGEWLSDQQFGTSKEHSIELLDELCTTVADMRGRDVAVNGLSLGGPHPHHVDLDWNFPFNVD